MVRDAILTVTQNKTDINATIAALDKKCASTFPNASRERAACDAVVKSLVDLLPWASREVESLAWDGPQLCAVAGICKVIHATHNNM